MANDGVVNRGWQVTLAGMGINLALGILYTWSVISKAIPEEWNWNEADKSWPYAIACLVFSLVMVPAGRLQDRISPRFVATVGGVLVGLGMVLASLTTSPIGYMVGFGLLAGAGIGFGYASATPPAVKWFPAAKTGMIAGLVVAGFGLASVYAAPLTNFLAKSYGIPHAMLFLGIAFLVLVVALAQLLVTPPKGYVPGQPTGSAASPASAAVREHYSPSQMLATWQFYVLWFMYACGAGAGLMVIAKLAVLAKSQVGLDMGFVFVATLAVGNGGGRVLAGVASDKIGRQNTMFVCFLFQACLILLLTRAVPDSALGNIVAMSILTALIGANYGANLALFPAITKDYYGLKDFGMNYGLVFTAWGAGGFLLPMLAGVLYKNYATFTYACYVAAGLLTLAALATYMVRRPKSSE